MAASSGAIRAGKAFVEFALRDAALRKGLKNWEKRFKRFGAGISRIGGMVAGVGGAVTSGFAAATKTFISSGDQLQKMALRTGLSVEALSELRYAAGQSGTSLESVEKGTRGMARMILDAERGLSTATDNLKDLGLSLSDLQGLKPEDQFKLMASRVAAIDDPSRRAALAMKAFGKSGVELLPMLENGAEGVEALIKQGHDLGLIMSDEDAQAAAVLGDRFDDLWSQLKRVVFLVGAAIAGPLTQFVAATAPILTTLIEWFNANRKLVATIGAVGAAILAAGTVLIGTGIAFSLIGVAAGGLAAAIGVVTTVLGALLSPIGLVVAGVAGLATWFLTATESGKAMVSNLIGWFGQLAGIAKTSFSAIAAALSAGDIAAAGEVLWASLKLLWLQGTQSLRETWHSLTGGIVKIWHMTWAGVLQLGNAVWGSLERGWIATTGVIANVFTAMAAGLKKAWNSTIAFFETTWLRVKGLFGSDVAGEIERINSELSTANAEIDAKAEAKMAARRESDTSRSERSRNEQAATLDAIGADLAAKLDGTDNATKQKIADAKKQLEGARAAWKDATAAAEAVGEEARLKKQQQAETGNALADATGGALGKTSSLGTFSADAVIALQSGGAEEETAKNTKRMAASLDRIEKKEASGLVAKS